MHDRKQDLEAIVASLRGMGSTDTQQGGDDLDPLISAAERDPEIAAAIRHIIEQRLSGLN